MTLNKQQLHCQHSWKFHKGFTDFRCTICSLLQTDYDNYQAEKDLLKHVN